MRLLLHDFIVVVRAVRVSGGVVEIRDLVVVVLVRLPLVGLGLIPVEFIVVCFVRSGGGGGGVFASIEQGLARQQIVVLKLKQIQNGFLGCKLLLMLLVELPLQLPKNIVVSEVGLHLNLPLLLLQRVVR